MINDYVVARIEAIQQELETLKRTFLTSPADVRRKTELKGLWRGIEISDEDFPNYATTSRRMGNP